MIKMEKRTLFIFLLIALAKAHEHEEHLEDHEHEKHLEDHHHHDERNEVGLWLASVGSIVVISLCGIFGVLVIPIMQKVFYQHLIQFLVALAIGTLSGDALLHLYPHALLADQHDHDAKEHEEFHRSSIWKGFTGMNIFLSNR